MALTKTEQGLVNRLHQRLYGLARRWQESASNDKNPARIAAKSQCATQLMQLADQFQSHPVTARAVTGANGRPCLGDAENARPGENGD